MIVEGTALWPGWRATPLRMMCLYDDFRVWLPEFENHVFVVGIMEI